MKEFDLNNIPKVNSGFKTPDDYFDNLSDKIFQQIKIEREQPVVITMHSRKKIVWMAAAAVLAIGILIPIINYQKNPLNQVEHSTLENYISYQSNINQYDLIEEMNHEAVEKIDKQIALENDGVEEYLAVNPNIENYITE